MNSADAFLTEPAANNSRSLCEPPVTTVLPDVQMDAALRRGAVRLTELEVDNIASDEAMRGRIQKRWPSMVLSFQSLPETRSSLWRTPAVLK